MYEWAHVIHLFLFLVLFNITLSHCPSASNPEIYGYYWLRLNHIEMQQSTEYVNNSQDVARVTYRSLDMHTELSGIPETIVICCEMNVSAVMGWGPFH